MQIDYDPWLIEQVVFLAVRRDPEQEHLLHAVLDPIYTEPVGRVREAKFRRVHAAHFARLQFDGILPGYLAERPIIGAEVGRCIIREAPRRKDESAELFIKRAGPAAASDRRLVIQVCPQSMLEQDHLASLMRRELLHVADMLDRRFAYARDEIDNLAARQSLVRDRYRVLWDIYVQGRLHREGWADEEHEGRLRSLFGRAYNTCPDEARRHSFKSVFSAATLTHHQLFDWAQHPEALFDGVHAAPPTASWGSGTACPLCGFPTHDWIESSGDTFEELVEVLRTAYPKWRSEEGVCRQCADTLLADPTNRRSLPRC